MPMTRSVVSEVATTGLPDVTEHPDIVFANIVRLIAGFKLVAVPPLVVASE